MCSPNVEHQRVNPTTRVILISNCVLNCENAVNTVIQWNVYYGFRTDYQNNDVRWSPYPNTSAYENLLFYGKKTSLCYYNTYQCLFLRSKYKESNSR